MLKKGRTQQDHPNDPSTKAQHLPSLRHRCEARSGQLATAERFPDFRQKFVTGKQRNLPDEYSKQRNEAALVFCFGFYIEAAQRE